MKPHRSLLGRRIRLLSTAVAAAALSACTLLKIQAPSADVVITLPSPTQIVVTSSYSISNLKVTVDGNDVSSQVAYYQGSRNYIVNLTLTAGMHTVVASADAYCSTCSPQVQSVTDTKTFCVAAPGTSVSKTIFAQADNLSWSSSDARTVALATDAGTATTQWTLTGLGFNPSLGNMRSTQFPCSCLRSPSNPDGSANTTSGASVPLAPCDNTDPFQAWEGKNEDSTGTQGLYQLRSNGIGSFNFGCLAEGKDTTAGMLVLGTCDDNADTPERLWKVRRQDNMEFETNPDPWEH
jgi:hypothetical protein